MCDNLVDTRSAQLSSSFLDNLDNEVLAGDLAPTMTATETDAAPPSAGDTVPDRSPDVTPPDSPPAAEAAARASGMVGPILLGIGVLALGLTVGWSVFWIIGAILISIFLHELGHFVAARASGMKATQFFIGFGPTIWSFQRGETEYGIKAIPAGAFVRIIGMSNLEEVDPADEARTYRQKSFPRRMAVAVAGSTMHFVQVFLLLPLFLITVGTPAGIGFFDNGSQPWTVGEVIEGSAAAEAGLAAGDVVTSIGGTPTPNWDDVRDVVGDNPGAQFQVVGTRQGEPFTRDVVIGVNDEDPERGLLGVVVGNADRETRSIPAAIVETPGTFIAGTVQSVGFLGDLLSPSGVSNFTKLIAAADDPEPAADAPAPPPSVDAPDETLRPVSILGIVDIGRNSGWQDLLGLMILLNLFIGIFNLLPMLPFDGGHVVIATYERIREALRGGRERYFADVGKLLPLTYVVVFLLVGLGISTIYLDVVDPLTG